MKLPTNIDYFSFGMAIWSAVGPFGLKMVYPYLIQAGDEFFSMICMTVSIVFLYILRYIKKK